MRKTYVWALDVQLPESLLPNHDNADCGFYEGFCMWREWPRNRKFLSEKAAEERAREYRKHGADVIVLRSAPVEFPSVAEARQQEIEQSIEGLRAIANDLQ